MTLNARAPFLAAARLPRAVGVCRTLRLRGTVRGVIPARGVPGSSRAAAGSGGDSTFADGRANRKGRFRSATASAPAPRAAGASRSA